MRFPKAVALTAFVIYALTLSRGMTINSMGLTAKVAGWDWFPMTSRPLTWLLTLPFHLLPAGWIPLALNLFAAATGALTLGLLARCVELLPWDCLPSAKKPWVAKLPVALAVAVCGFEFSFWQEAVAASGEMTGLLLFMASVWCLLEYRAGNEMRWLNAASLVWGLGMAENWLMLPALPLFVIALIVLRGPDFFRPDFVRRMALFGLAGFSLYAVLPLVNGLTPHSPFSFGGAWLAALHSTSGIFHQLYASFWQQHRLLIVAVLLYFLVPVLPCFIRLAHQNTDNLSDLDRFQNGFYRLLQMVLLAACLWLAFDPLVGPREIVRQQLGFTMPLLTFDLVNALGIAFLAGNFLFAAQIPTQRRPRNPLEQFSSLLRQYTLILLTGVALAISAGLVTRNLPSILSFNRQPLSGYGELMAGSLPAGGGIVLGDDPAKLELMRAALAGGGENRHWQFVNLAALPNPKYRGMLEREFPAGWSGTAKDGELKPYDLLQLLYGLGGTNQIFYPEPHNGSALFELFHPSPSGALDELKRYDPHRFEDALPSPPEITEGEKFWDEAWQDRMSGLDQTSKQPSRVEKLLKKRLAILPARRDQNVQLGRWYSVALNDWGVTLQQAGKPAMAQRRFAQALTLNPDNAAAATNLNCCQDLLTGKTLTAMDTAQIGDAFRDIRRLGQFINAYGEFDEPGIRCVLGSVWLSANWPRQAWQEFERARRLVPGAVIPQLAEAELYSRSRFDAEVFEMVGRMRPFITNSPDGQILEVELAMLEAKSWISLTNAAQADKILENLLLAHPESPAFSEMVFKAYLSFGEVTNALAITEAQLAKMPDNVAALNNRAALLIHINNAAPAIPLLDHALSLTNIPSIRLNRAIAYLQVTNLAAAEQDYTLLLDSAVDQFTVHYGLAQIALGRGDTNLAVQHLDLCLSNAPAGSLKWRDVRARLDALKH
ncbi:MAG TPA: tetratricopeptide repeat protein [Candidatus Acidoferrales bacterium]|jgi:tetratricopeptide (TPR) repeat protein|nr:tetratricopeptide repeat protein [Candidatus Acidoferrales bacterium]